jgi:signal transduction histidine kinase
MEKEGGILEINLDRVTLNESMAQSYQLVPGDFVNLSISDTGHGIDPAIKDRIFDPYFTTKPFGEGSGMGLAVVYSIVRHHKGAISVDSELGKGTTVNMFFPIIEKEAVRG